MIKKRVIVCDDDDGIVDVASIVLNEAGYSVRTVMKSSQIFETVSAYNPHLILLDLWMPDMSGEDITRKLKKNPLTKHIPIIIISASRNTENVALTTGADGYINKPFDIDELEQIVGKYALD